MTMALPMCSGHMESLYYVRRGFLLHYVYEGNVPGEKGENTYCYNCNSLLIDRYGFYVRANRIRSGCCPDCGASIDGIGMAPNREG